MLILQRQHERIQNQRKDYLNKLANRLVVENDRIAVEDLKITNMARNGHLSTPSRGRGHGKSIMDAGWDYFTQQLSNKAEEAGRIVEFVNPRNTSKTCSGCGTVHRFGLSVRWLNCDCGLSIDRDHPSRARQGRDNAALNILRLGRSLSRPSAFVTTQFIRDWVTGWEKTYVNG